MEARRSGDVHRADVIDQHAYRTAGLLTPAHNLLIHQHESVDRVVDVTSAGIGAADPHRLAIGHGPDQQGHVLLGKVLGKDADVIGHRHRVTDRHEVIPESGLCPGTAVILSGRSRTGCRPGVGKSRGKRTDIELGLGG